MFIAEIPIIDFYENALSAAKSKGYLGIICLIAREADSEEMYNEILERWRSFHDLTGNYFLFLFAGNNLKVYEDHSGIKVDHRLIQNKSIRGPVLFDMDESKDRKLTVLNEFGFESPFRPEKNGINQSLEISVLRNYLGLNERQIPCLHIYLFRSKLSTVIDLSSLNNTESLYTIIKEIIEVIDMERQENQDNVNRLNILKRLDSDRLDIKKSEAKRERWKKLIENSMNKMMEIRANDNYQNCIHLINSFLDNLERRQLNRKATQENEKIIIDLRKYLKHADLLHFQKLINIDSLELLERNIDEYYKELNSNLLNDETLYQEIEILNAEIEANPQKVEERLISFFNDKQTNEKNKICVNKLPGYTKSLIIEKITSGDLSRAIEEIIDYYSQFSEDILFKEIYALKARYAYLMRSFRQGIISYSDFKVEQNQITYSLLSLI